MFILTRASLHFSLDAQGAQHMPSLAGAARVPKGEHPVGARLHLRSERKLWVSSP